jgi:hypothetical protein
LLLVAGPLFAGPITDLFKKAPKPKPEERVPQLLMTVKTDQDEHKRTQAAEELREYDPAAFPDMIPTLIDVVNNDRSVAVRVEALQSLGKFRPVSKEVGLELEQAEKDPSMRVKIQARTSLLQYHLAGYHSPKKPDSGGPQSGEPPLAGTEQQPPPSGGSPTMVPMPPRLTPTSNKPAGSATPPTIVFPQRMPAAPSAQPVPQAPSTQQPVPPVLVLPPDATPTPSLGTPR